MKKKDYSNQKIGRLRPLKICGKNSSRHMLWLCKCDCGNVSIVRSDVLSRKGALSCGCLQKEQAAERCKSRSTHGMTGTPTYNSWKAMIQRCYDKNSPDYFRWGGRGISVCKRWRNSFQLFLEDMGLRPVRLTIDRINNEGNYNPNNCRWATYSQQNSNQRGRICTSQR